MTAFSWAKALDFVRTRRRTFALLLGGSTVVGLPSSTRADWLMPRHDAQRTGAAAGVSNITRPLPYWRAYLGGSLGSRAMRVVDVGGGSRAIVYVTAGRVTAKLTDDTLLWTSELLGVSDIIATTDIDGDGVPEIVTSTSSRVFVISGKDGTVLWGEPVGEMGTIGAVRVADIDGDKKPDIVITECACCAAASGNSGFAYSFASGATTPTKLWSLASKVACGGGNALTVADLDGNGTSEVVTGTYTTIDVVDGKTGLVLASSPNLGTYGGASGCTPVDLDGSPGAELVCVQNKTWAQYGHRIDVLKFLPGATPSLQLLWSKDVGDLAGGLSWNGDIATDLDGDGLKEIIISGQLTGGSSQTYVFDGMTGNALATIPNAILDGAASIESTKSLSVLTHVGTTISAWSFARATGVTFRWSLADEELLQSLDFARAATQSGPEVLAGLDLDGDGLQDLVAERGNPPTSVEVLSSSGGIPHRIGALPFANNTTALAVWIATVDRSYQQVVIATTDGILSALDNQLARTVPLSSGLRFGGYYAPGDWRNLTSSPVVGALDGGKTQTVLVPNAQGALIKIDATNATNAVAPRILWSRPATQAPAIVPGLNGGTAPGIVCRATARQLGNVEQIVALDANGNELWVATADGVPFNDVIPAKIRGGSVPDLVFHWGYTTDVLVRTRALSGADGTKLWDSQPIDPTNGERPAGLAVADWNKDGKDDVVYQGGATRVVSGADGSQILVGGPADSYFMPTIFDVDGDGVDEVTLHGGVRPAQTWHHDLASKVWTQTDGDQPFPYGAIASCPGAPVLAEGSYVSTARLKLTKLSGASAGTFSALILAGGKAYPDEASAKAAGNRLGQLTSASVHANLTGTSVPTVLVGSTDGWLYGVDPCGGTLTFSYDFAAPVGESVFGDTDGDGRDEILVSVADGYLYGMRQQTLPAPAWVWDTDPSSGHTSADVDVTYALTSLSAKWAAVAGAERYEVAAVGADGKSLTTPTWTDVGPVTETTLNGLSLTVGQRYTFAVRALSTTDGVGADQTSDGVVVQRQPGDAGPDASDASDASDATADAPEDSGEFDAYDVGIDAMDSGVDAGGDSIEGGSACSCRAAGQRTSFSGLSLIATLGALVAALRRRGTSR